MARFCCGVSTLAKSHPFHSPFPRWGVFLLVNFFSNATNPLNLATANFFEVTKKKHNETQPKWLANGCASWVGKIYSYLWRSGWKGSKKELVWWSPRHPVTLSNDDWDVQSPPQTVFGSRGKAYGRRPRLRWPTRCRVKKEMCIDSI